MTVHLTSLSLGWGRLEYGKLTDQSRLPLGSPRVAAFFSRITGEFSVVLIGLRSEFLRQPVIISLLSWVGIVWSTENALINAVQNL